MTNLIELRRGETYYKAAFYDEELKIPSIDTYIYDGFDVEHGHLFMNAADYLAIADGNKNVDSHFIAYGQDSTMDILDKQRLVEWLVEEHSQKLVARNYDYKVIEIDK